VLNPPDLGHLEVRIEHGVRGVRVLLSTDSAGAHDLIHQHLPALRAALEARDLRVDRIDVQTSDASSNLGDSGEQTQRRQEGDDERPRWSSVAAMEQQAQGEQQVSGEAASTTARERGRGGLLDLVA
jgi:flagellar hook-length control protein FliK